MYRRIPVIGLLAVLAFVTLPAGAADKDKPSGVVVDKDKRTVTLNAKIAPRKINDEKFKGVIYPIEVIACWPYPKGQKAHETVVSLDVKPSDVHKALADLGLKPGKPARKEGETPEGPKVNIYLELLGTDGEPKRVPIEKALIDSRSGKPMPKVEWRFTGSVMSKPDPNKHETVYGADLTGTLIAIFPVTDQTVFQTNLTLKEEKYVKLETDKKVLPAEGTAVKLILEVPPSK
jgi:hypothetical protein